MIAVTRDVKAIYRRAEAVADFVTKHLDYTEQVVAEMDQHPNEEPYLTRRKLLVGYERGVLRLRQANGTMQVEEVDYAVWEPREIILAWREMDE